MPDRQIARLLNRSGTEIATGKPRTEQSVHGFRKHLDIAPYRQGEWAQRGEITLEAAAKIIGVCNMTALRMLRRGDIGVSISQAVRTWQAGKESHEAYHPTSDAGTLACA